MPLYEYACGACKSKFELLRTFSAADKPAVCPQCGEERGRRLLSLFASFSKSGTGETAAISGGGGGGCSGCAGTNCATCH